ncbi:MAG TPA: AAA family ATPase [Clostridiales bacterium]|nr:AAA family ATPase [Clostridiales bacterium]
MKRLPYGISNYKMLVEENLFYVDKTMYIEKLENLHSYYIFFLRPRRFGKSLFVSLLQHYYDINEKDNFEALFKDTYIGQNPTKERNSYYVLKFNFSGITTDTKEQLEESFTTITRNAFGLFQDRYNIHFDYLESGSPASIFEDFIAKITTKIDKPVYVLIDEYDHFANELLSFQFNLFADSISKTGFVRKWYEVLKKATESIVKRIFATGVSPITLDSLTSGFNIADNVTREEDFNEMMGFTENEVRQMVKETARFPMDENDMDDLMEKLHKNYNGYLFSEKAKERLFNSDMILYYLKTYIEDKEGPIDLIDQNIASDYGKLGKTFDLKGKKSNMEVLEKILNGEEIVAQITRQFSMEKDFTTDDFKSLLFYLGLLTIDKRILSRVKLKVPNYVIKDLYFGYFEKKVREAINYEIDTVEISDAVSQIALEGKNNQFISVIENTLHKLSNRDYISFDEKYIKLIMLSYFMLSKMYMVKSEYEVESGYIDIALLRREPIDPDYFAIFEVKYIKKSNYEAYGEKIVEEKKNEAIAQILRYNTSNELKNLSNLKKWVIVFAGDKCFANVEI